MGVLSADNTLRAWLVNSTPPATATHRAAAGGYPIHDMAMEHLRAALCVHLDESPYAVRMRRLDDSMTMEVKPGPSQRAFAVLDNVSALMPAAQLPPSMTAQVMHIQRVTFNSPSGPEKRTCVVVLLTMPGLPTYALCINTEEDRPWD